MDDLYVVPEGHGPQSIIMLHGLALDHTVLRHTHRPLDLAARLVYVDLPGCGRSAEPADWSAVTQSTFVAAVNAVRNVEGIDKAFLLGHSYGCAIALEYALAHADSVAGLILCAGGPAMDHLEYSLAIAKERSRNGEYDGLLHLLANAPQTPADIATFWERCLPLYLHSRSAEEFRPYFADVAYRPASYRHILSSITPKYDVRDRLGEIRCPVLLVTGRHDWIHPLEHQAAVLHAGLRDSELIVLENSGTFPFFEEPEMYRFIVSEWLKRHRS